MDPLHPFVPITPPPPAAPTYGRVERIERDGQRRQHPDWEQESEDESGQKPPDDHYEDEYDPEWTAPGAAEPYGADGAPHDGAHHDEAISVELSAEKTWDPRTNVDRRSPARTADHDDDSDAGHIDISA